MSTADGTSPEPRATAALVVIGNEILSGKVADLNIHALATRLTARGVRLVRVEIVPDDIPLIAATVREARSLAAVVVTSGGVGPTHDDVTMDAIAMAFGVKAEIHPELVRGIAALKGGSIAPDDPLLRLCRAPLGATVRMAESAWMATAVMDNVYILPGVPELFARRLDGVLDELVEQAGSAPIFTASVLLRIMEFKLAPTLDAVVEAHPRVQIGSYPKFGDDGMTVLVTFDAAEATLAHAALDDLHHRVEAEQIIETRRAG